MNWGGKKVLVIGDLVLDVYHHGRHLGYAADAKAPAAKEAWTKLTWGGAGLLVRNILALGGRVSFVSLLGNDGFTTRAERFSHPKLKKRFFRIPSRINTVEEFFWIGKQKTLHWRHFDNSRISPNLRKKILTTIRAELNSIDRVVIADYRHGLLSPALAQAIIKLCKKNKKPLYIDSQIFHNEGNHFWYRGAYLFCLNRVEAKSADPAFNPRRLHESLRRLKKTLRVEHVVVKLGGRGSAALFGEAYFESPAHRVSVLDPTGAGDAFLGCLVLGDAPPSDRDVARANVWAALSTTIIGTEIAPIAEFKKIAARRAR